MDQYQSSSQKREQKKQEPSSAKLRGLNHDSPEVRMSKTISWILRHRSKSLGIPIRPDGYVQANELLKQPALNGLSFQGLERIVYNDAKSRYHLKWEENLNHPEKGEWWLRANQGHSMKDVVALELKLLQKAEDIPSKIAVHGTTRKAWEIIRTEGLSKMTRNHIHLAQGVPSTGVLSGMRKSSQIHIYIDIQKAMDAGIKFYLSTNGVVLSEGDDNGYIRPQFFKQVETPNGKPVQDWEPPSALVEPVTKSAVMANAILEPLPTPEALVLSTPAAHPADLIEVQGKAEALKL